MTPKEKAQELIVRFLYKSVVIDDDRQYYHPKPYSLAQQCALIAVDEILEICSLDCLNNLHNHEFEAKFNYWNEVKQELEKL